MIKKVKVVATVGPSCNDNTTITNLIDRGVDIFRLNFSYGTHKEHAHIIATIRSIANDKGRAVGILQDICGPKIRIEGLSKVIEAKKGERLTLAKKASDKAFTISYASVIDDLKVGDTIYFADGTVHTRVLLKKDDAVELEVLTPGCLMNGKGVNFPEADINLHALTDKDREDMRFGARHGVDFVAISFVSDEKDIIEARNIQRQENADAWILAKIERSDALENIEAIIDASDGVMVARGDLGAEVGLSKVPILQKKIIHLCNEKAKPVITATQMLTTMIKSPYPTRAEVSDIANAVFDGTDAVMLSDETAVGKYPIETVETLVSSILEAQSSYPYHRSFAITEKEAFPHAAASLTQSLTCDFIAALTKSGSTMLALSKYRPKEPLVVITTNVNLINKTTLVWGVDRAIAVDLKSLETEQGLIHGILEKIETLPHLFLLVTGYMGKKIAMGRSIRLIRPCEHTTDH